MNDCSDHSTHELHVYNAWGQVTTETDPSTGSGQVGTVTRYIYYTSDAAGNLLTERTTVPDGGRDAPQGVSTQYTYDAANQLKIIRIPGDRTI